MLEAGASGAGIKWESLRVEEFERAGFEFWNILIYNFIYKPL